MIKEITVEELKAMIDNGLDFELIDVRRDDELEINKIPESKHIVMDTFLADLSQFPKDKTYVIQCRSGGRSGKVVEEMDKAGFEKAFNLIGGITAWVEKIDPSQPTY